MDALTAASKQATSVEIAMALENVRNQKGCALFNLTTEVRIENVNECMIANALVGTGVDHFTGSGISAT